MRPNMGRRLGDPAEITMSTRDRAVPPVYRFYEVRGHSGYIHAKCWFAFVEAQRILGNDVPVPSSALKTIGSRAGRRPCLHCHEPLIGE